MKLDRIGKVGRAGRSVAANFYRDTNTNTNSYTETNTNITFPHAQHNLSGLLKKGDENFKVAVNLKNQAGSTKKVKIRFIKLVITSN